MILTGYDTAFSLEQAQAQQLARQATTYRALQSGNHGSLVHAAGATAATTEAIFGRKLNHAIGLGMGAVVRDEDLDTLSSAYGARGIDTEIDLCPHAHPSALASLTRCGFTVNAFSNTYARALSDDDLITQIPKHIKVLTQGGKLETQFVDTSVAGFAAQAAPKPIILLDTLARIAVKRADTSRFIATVDETVAGSAGMSILATDAGPVAHLYIASTLLAHRGRGVQLALLRARLSAARRAGCVLASVTARPTNASARNIERAGFSLAYTTSTFVKRN